MKRNTSLIIVTVLLTLLWLMPWQASQADPAYGLLRTFGRGDMPQASVHDIEVDGGGIYMVGYTSSIDYRQPQSSLTIMNPNHTRRCSNYVEFPVDLRFVQGLAASVELNQTHVFVAGIYWTSRLGDIAAYVAAFSKADCRLTGIHRFYVTGYQGIAALPLFVGEGIDLAVDETGVYLLVGLFIAERQGFYVVRLDQYLQPVNDGFYYIYDPARDLGLSIALGDQRVYVGGITGFDSSRWEGTSVFILELNKTDLSPTNTTILLPIEGLFSGLEIVVDRNNNDVYVIETYQRFMAEDFVVVHKFDRYMNSLWVQSYRAFNVYMDPLTTPPEHIGIWFAYGVSGAVSDTYLFIGGFSTNDYMGSDRERPLHGLLLAVNKFNGEASFGFRIRGEESPYYSLQVLGVDAFGDCVYLGGASEYYRLEYVFLNLFNITFPLLTTTPTVTPLGLKPELLDHTPDENSWTPDFDTDLGAARYGFYGAFCPRSLFFTTTSTSTTTATSTQTTTSAITSTLTQTTTATMTNTRYVTETFSSTLYTTFTQLTTSTYSLTETVHATVQTTVTDISTSIILNTVYATVATTRSETIAATTTVSRNTTTTATVELTTTVRGEVNWVELPPWFYLPFLLLPLPLVAAVLDGRRAKIIINRSDKPPFGWSDDGQPIIEDIYMKPSVVSVKKGATVTFVNKDRTPHVIEAYMGPAEYLFTSEEIKPEGKWKHKFRAQGVYHIRSLSKHYMGCIIHVQE